MEDADTQRLISRLAFAAADPDIRHAMNVEEEVIGELESLDTKVQIAKEKLAKAEGQLAERDSQLAERNSQLAEQSNIILATATALKQSGMPIEQIMALTKLTEEEIAKL